ncbi:MAG TPA: DNA polymerase [Segeticoccus sp.]|uniref:DNA polymerase n=1 Tax=Segeticoccus sp. TaxID=2706531 RepID=UPI002D7ED563|nr:DNA polymerase [Segeticoccus sp.]HET8602085.1 DNA polymerase [Segeticoccus sp.]
MSGIDEASLHALVVTGEHAAVVGPRLRVEVELAELAATVRALEAERRPRWVWWEAASAARAPVEDGVQLARCWDVAEAHRLLDGGWRADPATAVAASRGEPAPPSVPERASRATLLDRGGGATLFDDAEPDATTAAEAGPLESVELLLETARRQVARLDRVSPRAVSTATSESAAALLAVELQVHGLPVDRTALEELITEAAGPRPRDPAEELALRRQRDQLVLRHVPGRESTDLRNPAQVRALLAAVGIEVPDTRKHRLAPYRHAHPVVDALLRWRKAERIATTYGWRWLDAHVGTDDRLRGDWTACDGAAGRMTAQNGLHNLPTPLRPAVAAHPGHVLVRADLGQVEPRVLAAVSGDEGFAAAAAADDLYAPVARALDVERPVAKVAVLAAMYGQTSGPAGEALKRMERSYPTAMAYLRRAHEAGVRGEAVRTFGGRLVRMPEGRDGAREAPAFRAARGRFARNAVVQGAAAELFKAWAATVRAGLRDLDAQIVLCLHDELLVHAPEAQAQAAREVVESSLAASARRWAGSERVRFVADTSMVRRWSEAGH